MSVTTFSLSESQVPAVTCCVLPSDMVAVAVNTADSPCDICVGPLIAIDCTDGEAGTGGAVGPVVGLGAVGDSLSPPHAPIEITSSVPMTNRVSTRE